MRRRQRYQRLHHVPVLRQMLQARSCDHSPQTKPDESYPFDVLVAVDKIKLNLRGHLLAQELNVLVDVFLDWGDWKDFDRGT